MGLSQALSAALAGVNTTQQGLSVIAGNVANANTPGYVEESVTQVEVAIPRQAGVSVDTDGINRNLNTLLQSQLWTETSGGSYADTSVANLPAAAADLRHARLVDFVRRDLQQFHQRLAGARQQAPAPIPRRRRSSARRRTWRKISTG